MAPRKNPAQTPSPPPTAEEPSFEEALERLETIVEDLESGSLTLEESISRYEEGMRLSRRLTQTLDEAEKRIERLVESEGGKPATQPMDLEADSPDAGAAAAEPEARPASERSAPARPATETRSRPASEPDELPF
jgi:exodeoxyribonuclease VII small subunit